MTVEWIVIAWHHLQVYMSATVILKSYLSSCKHFLSRRLFVEHITIAVTTEMIK